MFDRRKLFEDLDETTSGFVKFNDNSKVQIVGRGDILIHQKDGGLLWLPNVLFVPQLAANILSLGQLDEEGCPMTMHGGKLTIFDYNGCLFVEV